MDAQTLWRQMEAEVPGLELHFKEDGYKLLPWRYYLAVLFVKALYRVSRSKKSFDRDFVTVFGRQIWAPSRAKWLGEHGELQDRVRGVLAHERVHLMDMRRMGAVRYSLSYVLLPLPFLWTWRAELELRGYTQSMLFYLDDHFGRVGRIDDVDAVCAAYLPWLEQLFCTGTYGWMMAPWRKTELREWLEQVIRLWGSSRHLTAEERLNLVLPGPNTKRQGER